MGSIYGLLALSLTLIFGIMRVVNFAHGALLMVAMYLAYLVCQYSGLNPYLAAPVVAVAMYIIGFSIQIYLIQPVLRKEKDVREPLSALLLTAGFAIVLENVMLSIFGANYKVLQSSEVGTITFMDSILPLPKVYAFLIAILVTFAFYFFLQKTELGRIIRAVGQDRQVAHLMGINVEQVYSIAFGIGSCLLGIAGAALIPFYYVHPSVGGIFGTISFVTVVLGGLGSVPGAIIGGLIVGIVESVSAMYFPNTLTPTIIFYAFLVFVFIRPWGIFGSPHEW